MEAKLKALKVVELKDILSKAQVTITGKANKADLIQKILASPEALAIAQGPSDPAPEQNAAPATEPEPVATVATTTPSAPATHPPTSEKVDNAPLTAIPTSTSDSLPKSNPAADDSKPAEGASTTAEDEDPELAKRKARAARFGIPLVEPTASKPAGRQEQRSKRNAKPVALTNDNPDTLIARANRFGIKNASPVEDKSTKGGRGNKRAAPATETVDPEEEERRKKRAERFGLNKAESTVKA